MSISPELESSYYMNQINQGAIIDTSQNLIRSKKEMHMLLFSYFGINKMILKEIIGIFYIKLYFRINVKFRI